MSWHSYIRAVTALVVLAVAGEWLGSVQSAAADIYVYRRNGTLYFTDRPKRPGYKLYLARPSYFRGLQGKNNTKYDQLIAAACQRYKVEFALVKAVIKAESAFDPSALSPAGAQGLMQLMPATAELHSVRDVYTPHDNIDGGVRHLRLLLNRFRGNLTLTLAAYNAGAEAVTRYQGVPPYRETQDYVQRVLRYRETYLQRQEPTLISAEQTSAP
jgi:soluble lytic murein transglycosylase-like protein